MAIKFDHIQGIVQGLDGHAGSTSGANLTLKGGNATSTGTVGTLTLESGTPNDENGGSIAVSSTSGVGTNRSGGNLTITAGNPTGSGTGGTISITAGQAGSSGTAGNITFQVGTLVDSAQVPKAFIRGGSGGTTGIGADTILRGGPGGATSGAGGNVTLIGGIPVSGFGGSVQANAANGVSNSAGGNITIETGNSTGTGVAGGVLLVGGDSPTGTGGGVTLQAIFTNSGGTFTITAGTPASTTGTGGNIFISGGEGGSTSGNGGAITVQGGTATNGNGGDVSVTGGNGIGTNRSGGEITIDAGDATGTGAAGRVLITAGNKGGAGTGGSVTINGGAGNGATNGGVVTITGGTNTSSTSTATVIIRGGPGGTSSGAAGSVTITGGTPVSGAGGNVNLTASDGVGTNQFGGNIFIANGSATGTGISGVITCNSLTAIKMPSGTSAQRPNTVVLEDAQVRYNTTPNSLQYYDSTNREFWYTVGHPARSMRVTSWIAEEFNGLIVTANTAPSDSQLTPAITGNGTITNLASDGTNQCGVVRFAGIAGAGTGGSARLSTPINLLMFGDGIWILEASLRMDTGGDNETNFAFGFSDNTNPFGANNGAYFVKSVSSPNLFAQNESGGVTRSTNVGVVGDIASFTRLTIIVNVDASSVSYYRNGILLTSIATNIPTDPVGVTVHFTANNTGLATERTFDIDYLSLTSYFTTLR